MNPDRNVQTVLASLGEFTPNTSPFRRLLVVPTWKELFLGLLVVLCLKLVDS